MPQKDVFPFDVILLAMLPAEPVRGRGTAKVVRTEIRPLVERPFLPALAGLRGAAVLLILANNLVLGPVGRDDAALTEFLGRCGTLGFSAVFVLSGFLLHYSYGERLHRTGSFAEYAGMRIARLFPLYLLCLLFTVFATTEVFERGWASLTALPFTLTMTQSWFYLRPGGTLLAQFYPTFSLAWTASTALLIFLAYPMLAALLRRDRLPPDWTVAWVVPLIFCLSLAIGSAWSNLAALDAALLPWVRADASLEAAGGNAFVIWLLFISPYARFLEFAIGVLAAHACLKAARCAPSPGETRAASIGAALSGAALVLLLLPEALRPSLATDVFNLVRFLPFLALLIFCCARCRGSAIARLLAWTPLATIGLLSYAVYLWQFALDDLFPGMTSPGPYRFVSVLAFWTFLVFAAWALHRFFAAPARQWLAGEEQESFAAARRQPQLQPPPR